MNTWKNSFWIPRSIPDGTKIGVVITASPGRFDNLCSLIHAIGAQTHRNWRVLVINDGEGVSHMPYYSDERISIAGREKDGDHWGHNHRQFGFAELADTCQYLCTMCDDDWCAPVYFEWMLDIATNDHKRLVLCNVVEGHEEWKPRDCMPKRTHVGVGGWIAETSLLMEHPWTEGYYGFTGDGEYVQSLAELCGNDYGKVSGYIYVHN